MSNKNKTGQQVTIKGIIYYDDNGKPSNVSKEDDIYSNKSSKDKIKFDAKKISDSVGSEVTSQATQSGFQAVVQAVQTQASSLGASGLVAVGSAGAFQVEHMHDNYTEAYNKAEPLVVELIDTGTISKETIAVVLPADSKFQGKELPVATTVLGVPVGEYKKQVEAEKNKTEEQKAIEEQFRKSVSPPSPSDSEKDGSMTSVHERSRSLT